MVIRYKMRTLYAIFCFVFIFRGIAAYAQDLTVTASANRTTVAAGETFEVRFTVNGSAEQFQPPSFAGLQVVSGPNQSTSMTSVNGKTTMSVSLGYYLVAEKEGEYTIQPATVQAGGKQYTSNTLTITVQKGSAGSAQRRQQETASQDVSRQIFIRAVPDKREVYQGEQLVVSYKLYTNIQIVGNVPDKMPDLAGFWSRNVEAGQQTEWTDEMVDGVRYKSAVLQQYILFPERAGKLLLDPMEMTFVVRQPVAANDPIERFFGGSYREIKHKAKSPQVPIQVRPLPAEDRPQGFSGAVGKFSFSTSVDRSDLKANEALNYTLKVSGSGNLHLLKAPDVGIPETVEQYDPKINDRITESTGGVSGSREFTYLMIPRHEGTYTLPAITFSYFDPAAKRYVTLSGDTFTLHVAKGDATQPATAFIPGAQRDIKLLDKDIRYIKTRASRFSKGDDGFPGSIGFWLLLLAGPLLLLAAFIYRNRYRERNRDAALVRNRNANKVAARHLSVARKQLDSGDRKAFYEAVYKGLYGYLSDKFSIPAASLNKEFIAGQLVAAGVDERLVGRMTETLDLCEMARFAPLSGLSEEEVYEKARQIINDMENGKV